MRVIAPPPMAHALAFAAAMLATAAQAGVDISTKPTQNMSCSAGVCTATAQKANLNVNDLTALIAAGDLRIGTGSSAQDIHIQAPFRWTSTSRLTLDAQRSIEFKQPVTVAGTGALTLITNDGGTGGDYWFDQRASVNFWDLSSSLIIDGQSFTLVNDIKTLASDIAANPSGVYAFADDYDASAEYYSGYPVATKLTGTFEGLGHTISNLDISPDGYANAAFFAEASGTLRDFSLENILAETAGGSAASLLLVDDAATIIGCNASGTVLGELGAAGGLVAVSGDAGGVIIRSHAAVNVSNVNAQGSQGPSGGLVGGSSGLNISLSSASGQVSGFYAGGLVGRMDGGSISQSFASGAVQGVGNDVQGSGSGTAGGLIDDGFSVSIQDSYATGNVHHGRKTGRGGFAGEFVNSIIRSSYSTGVVKRQNQPLNALMGGFVGFAGGGDDLKWDYWDIDTSGMTQGYGKCQGDDCAAAIQGLRTSQLLSELPNGFNRKIWGQNSSINHGYPYLLANPPPQ